MLGTLKTEKGNVLIRKTIATFIALGILAIPISIPESVVAQDYLTYDELKAYEQQKQEYERKQAEQEWSRQLVAYSQTLVGKRTGQCVLAIRNYFGISRNEVAGMAKYTKANTQRPQVGSVIIFKNLSKYGHVGIVIAVNGNQITYFDSNGDWRQRGAIRTIISSDRRISGYRIIQKI